MKVHGVFEWRKHYDKKPLAIVGPGPSYDAINPALHQSVTVFALNAAITEFTTHPDAYWLSNDHDRTFMNEGIRKAIEPRIAGYDPWRTITNRKFIPGEFGDIDWVDHHGRPQGPMKFRIPCPEGSEIWWYHENEGFPGYCYHGQSVLELALEVATAWGFDPIILFGVDLCLVAKGRKHALSGPQRPSDGGVYYASPWQWKGTPARIYRGKMTEVRRSIIDHMHRWSSPIYTTSPYWEDAPFVYLPVPEALGVFAGAKH